MTQSELDTLLSQVPQSALDKLEGAIIRVLRSVPLSQHQALAEVIGADIPRLQREADFARFERMLNE